MAQSQPPFTWANGYVQPAKSTVPAWADPSNFTSKNGVKAHYSIPPDEERPMATATNSFGICQLRSWPKLYDGTTASDTNIQDGRPPSEVDVLICGAGPFGLELAVTLVRQNVSFRIVDKSESPCLSGRADGVQPRAVEHLQSWGIGTEATEEGPLIAACAIWHGGVRLASAPTQCDSRNKGIHIITQGQLEKIYIRDLTRHDTIVERSTTVEKFSVDSQAHDSSGAYPVKAYMKNVRTGEQEVVRAKYLVGADGAASAIREQLQVPFDGVATDCYWVIMDARFKSDCPYTEGFSILVNNTGHGGVIIIPREDGFTRYYVQVTGDYAAKIRAARKDHRNRNQSTVGDTQIYDHGITPDEALELLNKIVSPYKIEYASKMSWFAVWRVNERVARYFSSADQRVHIGGDAAHVHSVLGAFGLNSSIYDAANLGWKLGMSVRGVAKPNVLLPTYDKERRLYANRVIRCSGSYLRFICRLDTPLAELRGLGEELEAHSENLPTLDGTTEADLQFLQKFFGRHASFLLGVEGPVVPSAICPSEMADGPRPTSLYTGVRAPSPRVMLSEDDSGYLYDRMKGVQRFHVLVFASDLQGPVRENLYSFSRLGLSMKGFYERFGGHTLFNVVLITKALPRQLNTLLRQDPKLSRLSSIAKIAYDDRAPDEDAHYQYGINHARGAVVIVRPDLVVGVTAWPHDLRAVDDYLSGFLNPRLPN